MKISLLQPKIIRKNVDHNLQALQKLINESAGDLLITAEYVLTGSLIADDEAQIDDYILSHAMINSKLSIPNNKMLLVNALIREDSSVYNQSFSIPEGIKKNKAFLDETEMRHQIIAGTKDVVFEHKNKKFVVLICVDMKYANAFDYSNCDFVIWQYHFTEAGYESKIMDAKRLSEVINKPILITSLVSDINNGKSAYINKGEIIELDNEEGILEIEI